jgi:hypothetical protein
MDLDSMSFQEQTHVIGSFLLTGSLPWFFPRIQNSPLPRPLESLAALGYDVKFASI